ncbi:uncharacterized protein BDW43DRAFT_306894 [Aspergillus alliaceus]|nr:uncharacterized protein BDW43DRAFT_306894 [Aspergillus alliaceus]KAB8238208.1 hypothetical protein BDW43DRAFT_306894 [Aspergillus alliaceus]
MSMPKAPNNEAEECIEDITFVDVPGALNLGNDPEDYFTPGDDSEGRADIKDEDIDYLGDMDDG